VSGTSDLTMVSRTRRRGVDDATRRDDSTRKKDHWYWDRATKGPRSVDEIEKNRFDAHGTEGRFPFITREQVNENKKVTGFKSKAFRASALFRLIFHGAVLFSGVLPPETTLLPNLETVFANDRKRDKANKRAQHNFGAGDGGMDKKRWSLELDEKEHTWVRDVEQHVARMLRGFNLLSEDHIFEGMTLLKTVKGTQNQRWHTDYCPGGIFKRSRPRKGRSDGHPCTPWAISVLIATEESGAKLAFPQGELNLKFGEAVVFAGDVVHAGCKYDNSNIRLHIYYGFDAGTYNKKVVHYSKAADGKRKRDVFFPSVPV
jgi:hypothetical protein